MAKFIVPLAIVAGGLVAEDFYLKQNYASFYAKTEQGLPKAYGLILLINVVVASFVVMTIGFKVGGARKKFQEEATAAGDKVSFHLYHSTCSLIGLSFFHYTLHDDDDDDHHHRLSMTLTITYPPPLSHTLSISSGR